MRAARPIETLQKKQRRLGDRTQCIKTSHLLVFERHLRSVVWRPALLRAKNAETSAAGAKALDALTAAASVLSAATEPDPIIVHGAAARVELAG